MRFRDFVGSGRVHFVGIGGAGMSGIAEVLLAEGIEVSGSDLERGPATERLAELGATVYVGHAEEHLEGAEVVVVSSAIPADNCELREARRRGLAVVRRAEMLGELMRFKVGVAVAGTHGKTTTTALVANVLLAGGLDPTVIVGGRLEAFGGGARVGGGEYLVAEADEFDRSFLSLAPIFGVITNVDNDHLDTYESLVEIEDAFVQFARRLPFFGRLIVCLDDPNVRRLLPRFAERPLLTYGLSSEADLRATDVEVGAEGCRFLVEERERGPLGRVELPLVGSHNVLNGLAAVGVGLQLGIDFSAINEALSTFRGVRRRFERLGTWQSAAVVDDYAHHPAEITATLGAARQAFASAEIHAVFQPHLYSRTRDLADELGEALLQADHAVVTAIYAAREAPLPGVTSELVVEAARRRGHRRVEHCADWRDVPDLLRGAVRQGDLVVTLGAGDIHRLAESLVREEAS